MATIKDIARVTGLGIATISKYLNGGSVRPKNRETIEKAIADLNYSVNVHARGLKTKRSMSIGAIIPELDNVFITTIMSQIAHVLRRHGYSLVICGCQSDEEQEQDAVRFLMGRSVDGIINMPINRTGAHLKTAIDSALPVVLIDRNINALRASASCVLVDNVAVSAKATQALLDAGHTRIGIIVGPPDIFTSSQRLLGYNQAHMQSGLMPDPEELVERIVRWGIHPEDLITNRFTLEKAGEAYSLWQAGTAARLQSFLTAPRMYEALKFNRCCEV